MLLRSLLLFILFWMIARAFWRVMDGVIRGATSPGPGNQGGSSRTPTAVKMAQCPICGTYVVPGKAISLARGGRVYYFCGDPHRSEFELR